MDPEEPEEWQRLTRRYPPPRTYPTNHPVNILYRASVLCGSLYILHIMDLFHKVLLSPDVKHEWIKVGLASAIAIAGIKAYMEIYEGKIKKRKIEYRSFKNGTHAVLFLFLLASFSFHIALWKSYGGARTILVMAVLGYGVLLQSSLLFPTWIQNAFTFVALTFFLQQYQ